MPRFRGLGLIPG